MEFPTASSPTHGSNTFSIHIDTLGQRADLNIYTQISLVYPSEEPSNTDKIVTILQYGLEKLGQSFPWTAGQVLPNESSVENAVTFSIRPFQKSATLSIKDLRQDATAPTLVDFRKANFPFRMFQERTVAPRMTFPKPDEEELIPVFAVQVNFIKGGMVLTFAGQHQCMDMTGLGEGIRLLDKACKGEDFTEEEIRVGNLDRRGTIPLIEDESYKDDEHLAKQIPKPKTTTPVAESNDSPSIQEAVWRYFSFSNSSLTEMKKLANESLSNEASPGVKFVSTDDVLTAFIFRSVIRARQSQFSSSVATATLARAVDIRRYLSIPPAYPGTVQNMSYLTMPIPNIVNSSTSATLALLASKLRADVDPGTSTLGRNTRALVTLLEKSGDMNAASITATLDLNVDIMLSSWASIPCYDMEFGLGLGKPEAVRRPEFETVESLLYFMPKRKDGEICVAVCLSVADMEKLKGDEDMMKYSTCIE
jgi:hypothetical protein